MKGICVIGVQLSAIPQYESHFNLAKAATQQEAFASDLSPTRWRCQHIICSQIPILTFFSQFSFLYQSFTVPFTSPSLYTHTPTLSVCLFVCAIGVYLCVAATEQFERSNPFSGKSTGEESSVGICILLGRCVGAESGGLWRLCW